MIDIPMSCSSFERERDADFFRERGFGLRIRLRQKSRRCSVVDIVKAFTDPQRMGGDEMGRQDRGNRISFWMWPYKISPWHSPL